MLFQAIEALQEQAILSLVYGLLKGKPPKADIPMIYHLMMLRVELRRFNALPRTLSLMLSKHSMVGSHNQRSQRLDPRALCIKGQCGVDKISLTDGKDSQCLHSRISDDAGDVGEGGGEGEQGGAEAFLAFAALS